MTNYAQPRVERNGCAMGNAARYAKFGSGESHFGKQDSQRLKHKLSCLASGLRLAAYPLPVRRPLEK